MLAEVLLAHKSALKVWALMSSGVVWHAPIAAAKSAKGCENVGAKLARS